MTDSPREVIESPVHLGQYERINYQLTTTPWASSPTTATVIVLDKTSGFTNVTETVVEGEASIAGDVITLPALTLAPGHTYLVLVIFTAGGQDWSPYFFVICER